MTSTLKLFIHGLMFFLIIFVFTLPVSAQSQTKTKTVVTQGQLASGEYRIGPADVLQISVWKNDALSRTVPVRTDGMISLPLINDVLAAGLTPGQLRNVLKSKLTEYIPNPEVSVIVTEMHSFLISVLGEVKKAGRYQFNGPVTVLDALARAGGITEFASSSKLSVLRSDGHGMKRIPFNYNKVITGRGDNDNFLVQPGDIIVVP